MRTTLFVLCCLLTACGPAAGPPESRPDALAKSLCGCTEQLLQLNQQGASGTDSLLFRNIAAEFEKTQACVKQLAIQPADRQELSVSLQKLCPALHAQQELLVELLGE